MNAFADTLHGKVRVSAWQLAFNRIVHGCALGIVLALAVYRPLYLLIAVVIALSYLVGERRARLATRKSVQTIRWQADGDWRWQRTGGVVERGQLVGATVIGCHIVILRLRRDGSRWLPLPVFLPADSLDADTHRRLRGRLAMRRPTKRVQSVVP